ncbi:S-layer homology domain-containing protein [Butyricicoccus sp. AF18-9LB]|uniref:S-layer homology domain-containing protein n=1 Tax=Butyricicoccus sp. AF18-9LB TaxID=3002521 RepID=UPI0013148696|nr:MULTISPECIES: S-layer homology domain-containing protein [unclassified Butyricicoccus]
MNKRIIASILTVIMLMTMLPTAAFAADGESTETGDSTTPETAIYLDQQHGADDNDGLSKTTAVQTIEKAKELANEKNINDICLSSFYRVTGTETWDLGGKTLHRYGLGGYMIELADASASLTLSNIVIDGAECTVDATHAAETDSIIKAANGGTIVLNSGAILQNNKAAQFGSGILANNRVNITMEDGAIIRNNTNRNYELGGGILIGNGSTFTMNGGEISGNTANGGGGVAIIGSTMVMNGGTISNNSTYKTSGQGSYGAGVYVADYANASGGDTLFTATPASFEMNGGSICDNTALDYGGGVLTFPQYSKKITININNGEISGNKVTKGSGGAVAAFFGVTELNIKDGTLTGNSAYQFGGGVFLYQATNVTISGGTISENKALRGGGGVCLREGSAVKQTGGSIENNVAKVGGGIYSGTYTMTGGVIKDNNNSLTEEARLSTRGDGVYVGTAFNLGNNAEISTNNDVYLTAGDSISKEGRYINVISPYTGASTAKPIQIHSEDRTVENTEIGTQLVRYTTDAGGETAAATADADGIFVPSWKMPEGLAIGQSKAAGKTDWMTFVPAVKIQYQWVSTDNPNDVTPPANDYIRTGRAYTAKAQQNSHQGYTFDGWYTDTTCTVPYVNGTVLNTDTVLYGRWKAEHGNLSVAKTVAGNNGDTSKAFNFTVTLGDTGINGTFGEMTFADGVATFVLKHGESKTAVGLPAGITYTVTEAEADKDGYTTTSVNASGSIIKDDTAAATFTNTRNSSSSHHSTRYTLHYESNGGTAYKDERYSSGTKVTLDKTPTRESYTFNGWYADKALTQKITSVTMNSDKTVYAGWEATGVPDKLNGDDHFAYVIGYPDGKVHPEGNISRAETATIFFRLLKADIRDGNLTADNDFFDVSDGQWHNKAVSTMAKLGIVKGRRADSFDPDASITRAEFAAICARFSTRTVENSGSFSDISGHWAENEIERAAAFGWISGYPDGTFRPDARITRAEAMTMINRVLCRMPQSESDLLDSMVTWPDNKPSDWHYLAVQEATNSHDFNRQGEVGESWTKLTSVPDWKQYQ